MAITCIKDRYNKEHHIIMAFTDGHEFLSNFESCKVTLKGENDIPDMEFDTVENAYMAWKTLDYEQRKLIQSISPHKAKMLSVKNEIILRDDYCDDSRLAIMYDLLLQKFSDRNPELKQKLLDTDTATIIEGNFHNDTFFGFCLKTWYGNNHLGNMHMKIRALLLNTH